MMTLDHLLNDYDKKPKIGNFQSNTSHSLKEKNITWRLLGNELHKYINRQVN